MKSNLFLVIFCWILSPPALAIDLDEFLQSISYLPFEYIKGGNCSVRAQYIRYELSAINVPSEEIVITNCGTKSNDDLNQDPTAGWLNVATRYGNDIFSNHHSVLVGSDSDLSIIDLSISGQPISVDDWERKTNTTSVIARIDAISTRGSSQILSNDRCVREIPDPSTFGIIEETSAESLIHECRILYHEIAKINSITSEEISIRQQKLLERTIYFWKIFGSWLEQFRFSKTEIEEGCRQPPAFRFPIFG
ncbi:MAG: hypothetical protein KDD35_06675 [Bdellovibrionales bacterium]|nr:hypothetical protein [Bdellovibrionales bacterium]